MKTPVKQQVLGQSRKFGAWPSNDHQVLAAEVYECAYEAVILIDALHDHTPARGNGGAACKIADSC